ncbi:MAG: alpha/beta hydrolase-fold protein [candidate division WOR-3 bacterium]
MNFLIFLFFLPPKDSVFVKVTFIANVPPFTPDNKIYLASNYNGWSPSDSTYTLKQIDEYKYEMSLWLPEGYMLEYKFTRGSWLKVEKGRYGEEIPNRLLHVKKDTTVYVQIENWRDLVEESSKKHTVTGNVVTFEIKSKYLRYYNPRKIWVYLPKDYHFSKKRYPVLYMHDGQNLFDDFESFAGEWHVDEILEQMHAEKGFSLIVVGIENAREYRIEEYTPFYNTNFSRGGEAEYYLKFIVDELKPYIDENFRTIPEEAAILGSSLGGLVSIYAGYKYPEVFKFVGSMSGAFWYNPEIIQFLSYCKKHPDKVYLDWGTKEGERPEFYVLHNKNVLQIIRKIGPKGKNLLWFEDPDGIHHESAWSKRLRHALDFLFSK